MTNVSSIFFSNSLSFSFSLSFSVSYLWLSSSSLFLQTIPGFLQASLMSKKVSIHVVIKIIFSAAT